MSMVKADDRDSEGLQEAGKVEIKQQFVEMRAKGWSLRKIASKLKISKTTAANWSQELEAEITSLKAMELEALYETYYLLEEGRIRLLGAILRKLKREISSRDFSEVATDKLLELLLKYQEALQAEYVEPRPLSVAALRTRAGTKLDSEAIAEELDDLLQRYQSGLVDTRTARDEVALLVAALKVEEQAVIEKKLERLESVLEDRR